MYTRDIANESTPDKYGAYRDITAILLTIPTDAPQRRALKDVVLKDGVVVPKGALIGFPCVPAGMDPSVFPEPEKFRPFRKEFLTSPVTTPTKNHLAFGWGIHFCLGAPLARLEGQIAIGTLLRRLPSLTLATEQVEWRQTFTLRGLTTLPIRF